LYDGYLVLSLYNDASHVKLEHHNQVQVIKGSDVYGLNCMRGHALNQGCLKDLDGLKDDE